MKIIPLNPPLSPPVLESPRIGPVKKETPDFATVLAEAQAQKKGVTSSRPLVQPGVALSPSAPAEGDLITTAGSLLDALEGYQRLLADQRVTLRELARALAGVEEFTARLTRLTEELEPEHPVKSLAVQLAATAAQESARFYSGAYIAK